MKGPYQTTASLICRHKRGENDKNGIPGKRRWLSLSIHLGNIIKLSSSAVGVPALCGSTDFTPSVLPRDCPGPSRELGHHWGHQAASQRACEVTLLPKSGAEGTRRVQPHSLACGTVMWQMAKSASQVQDKQSQMPCGVQKGRGRE